MREDSAERADDAHRAPIEAAAQRLAMEKKHVVALAAITFVGGMAGAMAYTLRRKPPMDAVTPLAQSARAHTDAATHAHALHSTYVPESTPVTRSSGPRVVDMRTQRQAAPAPAPAPTATTAPAADEATAPAPLAEAAKQGPLAIFREMNAAIFSAFRSSPASAPTSAPGGIRALRAARAPTSSSPVTSAHVSSAPHTVGLRTASNNHGIGVLHKTPQSLPPGVAPAAAQAGAQSNGPLLAFGAFSLATAIVGGVSLAVVLAVRQALNISTVEEFADWMHEHMPRLGRGSTLSRYVPAIASGPEPSGWSGPPPDDIPGRMNQTEDPIEWAQLAKLQLDHEHAQHQEERAARRKLRAQRAE
ncbi:hypothetical protein MBRA1_002086 [Malassezia brasiliensis]|uniref:Uncharacterized protein n=1 Tax=Malassezia brasiliensis TaxID=1821822 RepID=A0AAF0DU06_9BASI|nr:hypothetical protein MBRA1_002086 [Malassezia brasiliensis]